MKWIFKRIREPSTMIGLGVILTGIGEQMALGTGFIPAVIGGVLGVVMKEKGNG